MTTSIESAPRRQHTGTVIPEPDVPANVDVIRDVAFGPHERQRYDVYLPRAGARPLPVVVFFHPGGWSRRDKRAVRTMFVLEHGFALVSIGYRLAQHARFPAQVRDANAGLQHLLDHAAEYGIDPDRLVLAGTSAGAHIAAMVALARNVEDFAPVQNLSPRGVVAIYGAYDMAALLADQDRIEIDHTSEDSPLAKLLGGRPDTQPEAIRAMSPITHIRPDVPPFYLLHGMADHVLPWSQSADFAAALARLGVPVRFDPIPGAGHGDERFRTSPIADRIVQFVSDVVQPRGDSDAAR